MSAAEPVEVGAGRVRVRFAPDGTETRVPVGTTIFDAASWNGVAIDSTCGGHGTCKKCKVRLASGTIPISAVDPRAFTVAELKDGWRLACRAPVTTDLDVEVPPLQTRPKAALVGVGRHVILRPAVQKRYVELDEPSLEDQASDLERLLAAISDLELRVHLGAARALGRMLRSSDFKVTAVVVDDELIDIEPGDTTETRHAIAFDLGTTTVVATLLDLTTGQPLAVRSMLNRQQPYGADVISRVSATMMDPDALEALQARAAETLNMLAGEVCEQAGVAREQVYEISLCGNVTMTQLALGIDPEPLAVAPFIITARQLPRGTGRGLRRARAPARAGGGVPGPGRLRGRRHRGRPAGDRAHPRPPAAAVHRRRHQLRDRAGFGRARAGHRGTGWPGLRGGPDQVRDAGCGGRHRGRQGGGRRPPAGGDRRCRPGRHVRIRAGGRGGQPWSVSG